MPTTDVLDADQLEKRRFEEKVSEAMPPGVRKPETEDVDDTALQVSIRATANRALGPGPTYGGIGTHWLAADADEQLNEAKQERATKEKALVQTWREWIENGGRTDPPGDPSDMLTGASQYARHTRRSPGPDKFTTAARFICWRLAEAVVIPDE